MAIPTWSICQKVWPASTCHLEGKFPTPILHNQKNFWEIKQQWMNQWTICLKKVKVLLHKKGLQKVLLIFFSIILYCTMFLVILQNTTLSPDLPYLLKIWIIFIGAPEQPDKTKTQMLSEFHRQKSGTIMEEPIHKSEEDLPEFTKQSVVSTVSSSAPR